MKSKKTTKALNEQLAAVNERLLALLPRVKSLEEQISKAPGTSRMTVAHGIVPLGGLENIAVVSKDLALYQEYVQLTKLQGKCEDEKKHIESWLYPSKGRPRGRRNDTPKLVDPSITAALKIRKTQEGRKLTLIKLAKECSGLKTRAEWEKWIYRFKKENSKARRSQS